MFKSTVEKFISFEFLSQIEFKFYKFQGLLLIIATTFLFSLSSSRAAEELDESLPEEWPLSIGENDELGISNTRTPRQALAVASAVVGAAVQVINLFISIGKFFKRRHRGSFCSDFAECATACEYDIDCQKTCEQNYQCSKELITSSGDVYKPKRHKSASYECFNFNTCSNSCFDLCPVSSSSSADDELCEIDAKCMKKCDKMHRCSKFIHAKVPQLEAVQEEIQSPVVPVAPIGGTAVVGPGGSCTSSCGTTCHLQCSKPSSPSMMYRHPFYFRQDDECFMGCFQSCATTFCSN